MEASLKSGHPLGAMRKPILLLVAAIAFLSQGRASGQYLGGYGAAQEEAAAITVDAGQGFLLAGAGFLAAPTQASAQAAAAPRESRSGSGGMGGFRPFGRPAFSGAESTVSAEPEASKPQKPPKSPGAGESAEDQRREALQDAVVARARKVAREINSSGGYRFDGWNDCYGFVRRVWDPILEKADSRKLPVSDYPSREWAPVTNWRKMTAGDVLATHDGHRWGASWHGGLSMGWKDGKAMIFDNSSSMDGAHIRANQIFRYYHVPTHRRLTGED